MYKEDLDEYNCFVDLLSDLYSAEECVILRSAVEAADFELELPYEPLFIDMTDSDDQIVLGSTVTPFVLAIKTAEILLRKTFDGVNENPLREALKNTPLDIENLAATFKDHFKGIHFSNRKALGSGVYAVLFESLAPENPDLHTIHGRTIVNRKDETFIAMLYDLIFEADEVHRRLRGLIRPYVVMVKGPGPNALVTPMSYDKWAYASPEMLAIEQEAVALLSQ